jgi:putative drug exporter of the RND superfamily
MELHLATLLYKLGLLSARRAWQVIVSWIVLLVITAGLALSLGGKLTTSISIDGVPSQEVVDQLQETFPQASRASGQIVFHKPDGKFDQSDIDAITKALEGAEKLPGVSEVFNPFEVQQEIDQGSSDLVEGKQKLADSEAKIKQAELDIASGEIEIADGKIKVADGLVVIQKKKTELNTSLTQVNSGIQQYVDAGYPATTELLQSKALIEAGLTELAKQESIAKASAAELAQAEIDLEAARVGVAEGKLEIESGREDLEIAQRIIDASQNFTTISKDETVALATIRFDKRGTELEAGTRESVVDFLKESELNGIEVEFSQELTQSFGDILGIGEIVGLISAGIVLFVLLGTFIGVSLPIFSAVVGVGISATITLALASQIEMTSTTPVLGVMLGLAVGIDYSLFIVNRHRRQLKSGAKLLQSIATANGTSGNAVLFAGVTVVIALVALNLTGIGFVGLMGSMGAIAIVVAVLIALTATPAALSLIGDRILTKKERASISTAAKRKKAATVKTSKAPVWATKNPWLALAATISVLVIMAIPLSEMRLGLPDGGSEPTDSSAYKSYTLVSEAFGPGFNGQITTVLELNEPVAEEDTLTLQSEMASALAALANVTAAVPAAVSDDKKTFLFQVVPTGGPSSVETEQVVYEIRDLNQMVDQKYDGKIGAIGITATNIDVSDKISDVLPLYLSTVIVLSLLLLMLVFRSILIPILAAAGFLLTVTATLGAVVAVYQWGWLSELLGVTSPGPILSFLPIFLIGIIFGLAMDYQLFLVSGMREAFTHGKKPKDAINYGIHQSRGVVVAAALIMVTVFGGFAFSHLATIRPIGFGLAIGVLIDAFLVRLILVPAAMTILDKSAWWIPKWLDKALPDVDVEGTKIENKKLH